MSTEVTQKHGLGEAYKRKEDARFIRGQGNYVDDVQLPGMLYGDIVRSPYAHALIKRFGRIRIVRGKEVRANFRFNRRQHVSVDVVEKIDR